MSQGPSALATEMSSQVWSCTSSHLSCSGKSSLSACIALFTGELELPWYVGASSCRWLNEAVWAARCPARLSLLSLPINTGAFVSGLIVPLPSQSPFCALLPAQRLCSGVFSSAALCLRVFIVPAAECVCLGEERRGSCLCGVYKPSAFFRRDAEQTWWC